MRFVIVTGLSGAGKSSVLKMLEDSGYFCVDNLPIQLIVKFAQLTLKENGHINQVALGIDIRSGEALSELEQVLSQLEDYNCPYEILFLDSSTEVLVKRFKETRRTHPLSGSGRVDKGIETERKEIEFLKKKADYIIDTSQLLVRDLKSEIDKIFVKNEKYNNLIVTIVSFGFKYGLPIDSDLVFDVRFLPNPYYEPELKPLTGNDQSVYDYVMALAPSVEFLDKVYDLLSFLIPNYIIEGKNQLVISIGCTGGKHRSVTLANALSQRLSTMEYGVKIEHRDIHKDSLR